MADERDRLTAALAGRYTIERELGRGGMATVYLAEDVKHRRRVAIKVLHPELAAALGPERFLREIETTAALRHPHILPLYDSGQAGGQAVRRSAPTAGPPDRPTADFLFYVMPYVEGESLRDRLDREKQLPLDDALQIAREVADALSYAHSRGVIHRDIKPENILLESGHAVVADFGIARAITAAGGDRLTQTGVAVGTPAYMSPEQGAGSGELDGRSDLYALGCVLYEMLAGQPPFTGPTVASVLSQHLTAEPRAITQIRPAVPAEVAGVLQRALAKNPADRFNPVAQFADALQRPVRGAAVVSMAPRRGWLVAAAVAVVVVVAGVAWLLSRGAARLPVIVSTAQVTRDPGLEVDPALSPDGTMVAYAAGTVSDMQIVVRQVSGGRTVALTNEPGRVFRWPRWSPDGSQIAYQAVDGVYVVPALGGPHRIAFQLDTTDAIYRESAFTPLAGLAWSPDGRRLAVLVNQWSRNETGGNVMVIVAVDGGARERVLVPAMSHSPAWSPDGRMIALTMGNPIFVFGTAYFANAGASAIWVVPLDRGDPHRITSGAHLDGSARWSPDGRHLFFVSDRGGSRDVYRVRVARSGTAGGPIERLTTGLDAHTIDLSRNGSRLAYSRLSTYSNIWVVDRPLRGVASTTAARPVTTGQQMIESVDVTADGRRLVFDSDRNGNADIYTMPTTGGEPVPITTDSAGDFSPAWSPDGRRIVFHSLRHGQRDVYTVNADGTGLTRRTSSPAEELDPDWAPDGRVVLYEVISGGEQWFEVRELDAEPPSVRRLPADGDFARWSSTGSIAYHARDGIRVVPATGGGPSRLLVDNAAVGAEAFYAAWAPDGRALYYLARGPEGWSIRAVPAAGGASRVLVRFDDPQRQHTRYGFSTDGDRFYLTIGGHESDVWVMDLERR